MLETNFKNWDEFKINYRKVLSINGLSYDNDNFIFRGQMDSKWRIESAFDRVEQNKSKHDLLIERFKYTLIKHQHPILDIPNINDDIITAFGQHHGLPTRLLDWSKSPYIAAFFAFSDAVLNNYKGRLVTIWAINKKSECLKKEIGLKFLEIPNDKLNQRLRNQLGQFTLSTYTQDTIEDYVEAINIKHKTNDTLWRFNIPTVYCKEALSDLELMNINYNSIYPDTDGFAKDSVYKILK